MKVYGWPNKITNFFIFFLRALLMKPAINPTQDNLICFELGFITMAFFQWESNFNSSENESTWCSRWLKKQCKSKMCLSEDADLCCHQRWFSWDQCLELREQPAAGLTANLSFFCWDNRSRTFCHKAFSIWYEGERSAWTQVGWIKLQG